ncbi:MAG TPA: hypothetical protein VHB18_05255 [Mycobacteriales bacterium]|nr:hypothetical protein [Mycobacteriales bacterium]
MLSNPELTVPVTPAPGSALHPLAEEISWAAWRVTGAACLENSTSATLLHHRTRLLAQALSDAGRTVLVSQVRRTGGTVVAELAIGCVGSEGSTTSDLRAARTMVRTFLAAATDLPLALTEVDPTEVLQAPLTNAVDHGVIRQHVIPIYLGVAEERVDIVSRFHRMPNPWLAAMRMLSMSGADATVRVTALPTSLDVLDHTMLQRAATLLDRSIAARALGDSLDESPLLTSDSTVAPRLRLERARRTAHDLIESFSSLAFACELAYISSEPVPPIAQRTIAGAFTSDADIVHQGEVAAVAANTIMLGGFDVDVRPDGLLDALSKGLPLHGGTGERELRDLVTLAELPFGLPAPDSSGLPGTSNHIVHSRPVPEALRDGAFIGLTPDGDAVHLPREAARRHGLYIGTTGSGKSTRMVKAALTDLREGRPIVFIDPHGTAVGRLRGHIAAETITASVHVIALSGGTTGWRPFEALPSDIAFDRAAHELAIASIGEFVAAVRSSIPKDWTGPRFDQLARAIVTMAAAHGVHLGTALVWFIDPQMLAKKVRHPSIPVPVRQALLRAHGSGTDGISVLDWVVSKFAGISEGSLGQLLSTPRRGLTGPALLREGSSLLVDLSGLPAQDAALFGHLVLAGVLHAAMSTPRDSDLNIYVDEAQRFPVPGLTRILTEGRKFSASVHLASQSLATLDSELADAACGAATLFAFRQSPDSAERLAQVLGVPAAELQNLPDLTAAVKVLQHPATTVVLAPYDEVPEPPLLDLTALDGAAGEPEWLREGDDDECAEDEEDRAVTVSDLPTSRSATGSRPGGGGLVDSWRRFSAASATDRTKDGN